MGLGQQRPCRARAGKEDTEAEMGPWAAKGSSDSEGTRCLDPILVLQLAAVSGGCSTAAVLMDPEILLLAQPALGTADLTHRSQIPA